MAIYRTAAESREAGVTYHLSPVEVWERQQGLKEYIPEAFPTDGFIHCTNGTDPLIAVANMFYTADRRPFTVLVLDLGKVESSTQYDDPDETFPHIYGPLNTSAIKRQLRVTRSDDGSFLSIEE